MPLFTRVRGRGEGAFCELLRLGGLYEICNKKQHSSKYKNTLFGGCERWQMRVCCPSKTRLPKWLEA